ncbi:Hpt domain-containing protein [Idiomarina loihiensis]|jgi:HPt (histidine-containing phosphotransfer) domain-containing protein|uniref:Probable signal transduction protein, containing Hpt domain n=1 Tax=Idiomarina loihiensis (strain ATCC BAA-735 / DSM 15497 / L2-TR) TaxID=283942 RepID=Q5R047_IDILO|nr:Hpt domain-containing protein [Idiomarina loihiensis]AAV81338.1 Probable signal transduction protein, containing Hpt domain [Idiomarina loihiensis L2TR]AGM35363.1 signal transduction protein [Idiomarina loihiensis GSL 199]PHQ90402.1 MAG: Hpt domain-containing protein [Idiomarina sp.]|tara:strand:- start:369 stop:725 length:357 start_codon:yes stop_codon:yes gene_type:complete
MSSNSAQIDFNRGLRHCDNQHSLYREVLNCYLEQFAPLLNTEDLLEDVEAARLKLHTLKSLSATIGATDLSLLAAQLFKDWQLKTYEQRIEAVTQVNAELAAVNEKIASYCNDVVPDD